MRPGVWVSFVGSVAFHALVLFGRGFGSQAKPLPLTGEPATVEVSLVDASAGAEVAAVSEPEPEPPMPEPAPEPTPEPHPEPAPEPTPAPAEPVAAPEPTPPPAPQTTPKPHPAAVAHAPAKTASRAVQDAEAASQGNYGSGGSPLARSRSNPKPPYPPEALRDHHEGVVIVAVEVSAEGKPVGVELARGSGFAELDASALRTLWRWRFEPARAGGIAVSSRVNVPVRFRIEGRNL